MELSGQKSEVDVLTNGISEPKGKPDGPETQRRFLGALRDDQERLQRARWLDLHDAWYRCLCS